MMIMKNLTAVGPILNDFYRMDRYTYYNSIKSRREIFPFGSDKLIYTAAFTVSSDLFLKYSRISAETTSRFSR